MRKVSVVAVLLLASFAALAGTASAAPKPAKTGVSIRVWPEGLFGYLNGPVRCTAGRTVVVYRQVGSGADRADDKRVGSDRADTGPHPQWSLKTAGAGNFYAVAAKKSGCAEAVSKPVQQLPQGPVSNDDGEEYPPCSGYVSEGPTSICKFDQIHLVLDASALGNCYFYKLNWACEGITTFGDAPWAHAVCKFSWNWNTHQVLFVAYPDRDRELAGQAHLSGTMPSSSSPEFTVTEAYAQNDKGYPNGDHFFTPNLPGAAAGQVGGPLYVNFVNGAAGADAYIQGFLYLKR